MPEEILPPDDPGGSATMLMSILPGLRDLRTPLATGYLYLTLLWLLLGGLLPEQTEASGLVQRVYDLGGFLGVSAAITVLTFVAYILGCMLTVRRMPLFLRKKYESIPRLGSHLAKHYPSVSEQLIAEKARQLSSSLQEKQVSVKRILAEFEIFLGGARLEYSEGRDYPVVLSVVGRELPKSLASRIEREVSLMAVRLHAKNKELFDDYDRSSAEAEFRSSIAVPVALIVGSLPFVLDGPLFAKVVLVAAALAVGFSLSFRAMLKSSEAESTVIQAMSIDEVQSPTQDLVESLIARQKESDEASAKAEARVMEADRNRQPSPQIGEDAARSRPGSR